jgi:hypothetical protein
VTLVGDIEIEVNVRPPMKRKAPKNDGSQVDVHVDRVNEHIYLIGGVIVVAAILTSPFWLPATGTIEAGVLTFGAAMRLAPAAIGALSR